MTPKRSSIFALAAGRRSKWVVLAVWVIAIFGAGAANLPGKFTEAEDNESASFLPASAESTEALEAAEELQGGELAPAVILFRREAGLSAADRQRIADDVRRLTEKRYRAVVADGATAAAGGGSGGGGADEGGAAGGSDPPAGGDPGAGQQPEGCGGPTTPIPGQPSGYSPFVGPICSADGRAAIVTAYLRGDGEADSLLDPIQDWREAVSDPGGGLEVKITGGAGYAADAIEVFESINGTLLLAALSLVIFLLIAIYRSPIFLFIPLAAVVFAEVLARSVGYGISELGVTINGQSSSIMSVLVLGAGTDYALLIVARYREELHHTEDRHEAMTAAMKSAGPAVFASAATVIAALLCLTIAKVNGTAGLGPIGAMGVACAAIAMLTLLPALLTIFGRRAFWPFVPHTPAWTRPESVREESAIVSGGRFAALLPVLGGTLLFALLLPLVGVIALAKLLVLVVSLGRVRFANPIFALFDRKLFAPYEVRRREHERLADTTHGFWRRVCNWVDAHTSRVLVGSTAILLVLCAGLAFFSTDLTTNDSYTTDVESVDGQELLTRSFPAGAAVPTDVIVPPGGDVEAVSRAVEGAGGIEAVTPPVAEGERGTLLQATLEPPPYSTDAFDLIEPIRDAATGAVPGTIVGGPSAIEFDVREAAAFDSILIPPIVLVVVFLILVVLLRAVIAPLILIGTVIVSFAAALGVGYFVFDVVFGFPGSDPSLPLFAFVFLVALGVDYNIFLMARAREETLEHGTRAGVLRALAVTGGVITSAGIVLAGTFSVLAALPLVFLTEIGFVVAFGVLLDTFLVRSVVVPAIVLRMGPKVWWPSKLAKTDGGSQSSSGPSSSGSVTGARQAKPSQT